jgi:hypothetical protein
MLKIHHQRLALLLVSTVVSIANSAFAAVGFVCTTEHAAGIGYDTTTKTWSGSRFLASGNYLITTPDPEQSKAGLKWIVKDIQSGMGVSGCESDFDKSGYLTCKAFGEFIFNKKSQRFLRTYTFGYVTDGVEDKRWGIEGKNTPMIEVGRCTSL